MQPLHCGVPLSTTSPRAGSCNGTGHSSGSNGSGGGGCSGSGGGSSGNGGSSSGQLAPRLCPLFVWIAKQLRAISS